MSFHTYLKNIAEKTGKSPEEFLALAAEKGFTEGGVIKPSVKAMEIVNWLKEEYNLGHGHAQAMLAYIKGKRE